MRLWKLVKKKGDRHREMEKSLRGSSWDIMSDDIMSDLEDLTRLRSWHKPSSAPCNEKVKT